jgi:hypothetical protein
MRVDAEAMADPLGVSQAEVSKMVRRSHVTEMTCRERPPGTGLEVLLEAGCLTLGGKLQNHDERPRPAPDRFATRTVVVPRESAVRIRGEADVMAVRVAVAPENVDEALADAVHPKLWRKGAANGSILFFGEERPERRGW